MIYFENLIKVDIIKRCNHHNAICLLYMYETPIVLLLLNHANKLHILFILISGITLFVSPILFMLKIIIVL